jgi:hypothetical protein
MSFILPELFIPTMRSHPTCRASPLQAQKRRVLACSVLYRSGAPDRMKLGTVMSLFVQTNVWLSSRQFALNHGGIANSIAD